MKSTNSLLFTNLKINYDSQKNLDKKIDLIYQNQKLINSIDDRIKTLKLFKIFLIKHKLNLVNLINTEAHKTKNESLGEFEYALDFVDYSINLLSKYNVNVFVKMILLAILVSSTLAYIFVINCIQSKYRRMFTQQSAIIEICL